MAVGDFEEYDIVGQAKLITEAPLYHQAEEDLVHLETYIKYAEKYLNETFWGALKQNIMPPAFPSDITENPFMALGSPTIVNQDQWAA